MRYNKSAAPTLRLSKTNCENGFFMKKIVKELMKAFVNEQTFNKTPDKPSTLIRSFYISQSY